MSETIRYFAFALAALSLIAFHGQSFAKDSVTLTYGEWPPLSSVNLMEGGLFCHLSTAAFKMEDMEVKYHYMPWKRAMESASFGDYDGTVAWRKSPQWEKDFLYSDPVFTIETVFYYNKSNPVRWEKLEDVGRLKLGATRGFLYINLLQPIVEKSGGKLEIANDNVTNFKKLAEKRIDLFPCASIVARFLMAGQLTSSEQSIIATDGKPIMDGNLYLLISKKAKNGSQIIKRFNSGLKKLYQSGEYDRIVNNWINIDR